MNAGIDEPGVLGVPEKILSLSSDNGTAPTQKRNRFRCCHILGKTADLLEPESKQYLHLYL